MPLACLAGPDVFLPDAPAHAARKSAICAAHGITALPPFDSLEVFGRCVAVAAKTLDRIA